MGSILRDKVRQQRSKVALRNDAGAADQPLQLIARCSICRVRIAVRRNGERGARMLECIARQLSSAPERRRILIR